ncbi:MAG: heme ABC exporter ATP-binding protein CcmA, partial [Pseudomonadota bacterium]
RCPLLVRGPNGAGKTSLLRVLGGLADPLAGQIAFVTGEGHSLDSRAERADRLHFLGHTDGLKPALTVADHLSHWSAFFGPVASQNASAMDQLGLDGLLGVPVRFLSVGQRRRVALARLLHGRRPVWLLDEPSSGLDAEGVAALEGVLNAHAEAGGVVVAATHLPLALANSTELHLGEARS